MIRRVIAAVAALLLASVGVFLVITYADKAEVRALENLETVEVLVATDAIAEGTSAEQLTGLVEVKEVPRSFLASGTVDDLEDLEGRLLTADLAAGEQLRQARFATPEELRARDEFELPEEAQDLHQVTVPLEKPRALGGNIAPGDTVGVFISVEPADKYEGEVPPGMLGGKPSMTHLELHKVLVVRVEGGYVAPPEASDEDADAPDGNEEAVAADIVNVTLALEAPDAEQLVFGMEYGKVWLSYEPEDASEEGTRIVMILMPRAIEEIQDIYGNLERVQDAWGGGDK
jgi:pilus assembly protein CpaB